MCIKRNHYVIILTGVFLLLCVLSIRFLFTTVTIKVKTSTDEITSLIYNSTTIQREDYEEIISKIEKIRLNNSVGKPETREMDLYIVIKSSTGDEIIEFNDDCVTHLYNNNLVGRYTVPLITQIYIQTQARRY